MTKTSPVVRTLLVAGSVCMLISASLVAFSFRSQFGFAVMVSFLGLPFWLGALLTFCALIICVVELRRGSRFHDLVLLCIWAAMVLIGYGCIVAVIAANPRPI